MIFKQLVSDLYTFFYKKRDDGQNKTHLTSYLQNIIDILRVLCCQGGVHIFYLMAINYVRCFLHPMAAAPGLIYL